MIHILAIVLEGLASYLGRLADTPAGRRCLAKWERIAVEAICSCWKAARADRRKEKPPARAGGSPQSVEGPVLGGEGMIAPSSERVNVEWQATILLSVAPGGAPILPETTLRALTLGYLLKQVASRVRKEVEDYLDLAEPPNLEQYLLTVHLQWPASPSSSSSGTEPPASPPPTTTPFGPAAPSSGSCSHSTPTEMGQLASFHRSAWIGSAGDTL